MLDGGTFFFFVDLMFTTVIALFTLPLCLALLGMFTSYLPFAIVPSHLIYHHRFHICFTYIVSILLPT